MSARFLCDAMLGDVARWLRLMGFDAEYAPSTLPDAAVAQRARSEHRVLLTRDARLHDAAARAGGATVLLPARDLDEDLVRALWEARARPDPSLRYSRCSNCNAVLDRVTKGEVDVPPKVRERHDAFWRCPSCDQVFWAGTHVAEIEKRLRFVTAALESSPARG